MLVVQIDLDDSLCVCNSCIRAVCCYASFGITMCINIDFRDVNEIGNRTTLETHLYRPTRTKSRHAHTS